MEPVSVFFFSSTPPLAATAEWALLRSANFSRGVEVADPKEGDVGGAVSAYITGTEEADFYRKTCSVTGATRWNA